MIIQDSNREGSSQISKARRKKTGEVFTGRALITRMVNKLLPEDKQIPVTANWEELYAPYREAYELFCGDRATEGKGKYSDMPFEKDCDLPTFLKAYYEVFTTSYDRVFREWLPWPPVDLTATHFDLDKTMIEPMAGDGNIVLFVYELKVFYALSKGYHPSFAVRTALEGIYAREYMLDNVEAMKERLRSFAAEIFPDVSVEDILEENIAYCNHIKPYDITEGRCWSKVVFEQHSAEYIEAKYKEAKKDGTLKHFLAEYESAKLRTDSQQAFEDKYEHLIAIHNYYSRENHELF